MLQLKTFELNVIPAINIMVPTIIFAYAYFFRKLDIIYTIGIFCSVGRKLVILVNYIKYKYMYINRVI